MKQRPSRTGEEFQENTMAGVLAAAIVVTAILVAGVALIVRGLT